MIKYRGIATSEGIGVGIVTIYHKQVIEPITGQVNCTQEQMKIFTSALQQTKDDLLKLAANVRITIGEKEAQIFDAHCMMLEDPEIVSAITSDIQQGSFALNAIGKTMDQFIAVFETMDDDYMKARAQDLRDLKYRLSCHVLGIKPIDLKNLAQQSVLVVDDLLPSETAQLNAKNVAGIITKMGGKTSHTAIMSRTLGIPSVVIADIQVEDGAQIIVDGSKGEVIVAPNQSTLSAYQNKQEEEKCFANSLLALKAEPSFTADGQTIEIAANIGNIKDAYAAKENGAEGIGLFRSEFLFLDRVAPPSEEEQYTAYSEVLALFKHRVVIRTLDIGGDKHIPYMDFPEELNPFLGLRAIRYCFQNEMIFRTQIRALLRASVHGHLAIMFPMIGMLEEIRLAKQIIDQERTSLISSGVKLSDKIEVGMMMEIPSAAIMADAFAKEVDFFSIGTNDLIQYTIACDRMNVNLQDKYTPLQPAVLHLISNIVDSAKRSGIWVGMCGEAAANQLLLPVWIALGFDELSMSAGSVLKTRHNVSKLYKSKLKPIINQILELSTVAEMENHLREINKDKNIYKEL